MKKWTFAPFAAVVMGSALTPQGVFAADARQSAAKETAGTRADAPKSVAAPRPSAKFSMEMLSGDRMDIRYTGPSVSNVIREIEKLTQTKKGEFESTDDFNARRRNALSNKLPNGLGVGELFGFVLPVPSYSQYQTRFGYEYDADAGSARLYVLPEKKFGGVYPPSTNGIEIEKLDVLELDWKVESKSNYVGSNAFGATAAIKKIVRLDTGIAAERMTFLDLNRETTYSRPKAAVRIDMVPTRAAVELPALKVLVIMRLSDPYIIANNFRYSPTLQNPEDLFVTEKLLFGSIYGIVFFSGKSGEIFAKLPTDFGMHSLPQEDAGVGRIRTLDSNQDKVLRRLE